MVKNDTNKNLCFCIDFEDWFHIPYLFKYNFSRNQYEPYANKIIDFMEYLAKQGIYATVFVVADIAEENKEILQKISNMGHEIECHSLHHNAINTMSTDEFIEDTLKSKNIIEKIIKKTVIGYRAPYFSMSEDKLQILKKLGFKFDSSYINSTSNEYYNQMNISDYCKIDSLIYSKDNLYELEIPTLKGRPIAGGGFFRLFPFCYYLNLIKKFCKLNNNYIFFIHPFEIVGNIKFDGLKKIRIIDRFRFQIGRRKALIKVKRMINYFKKHKFNFVTMYELITFYEGNKDGI